MRHCVENEWAVSLADVMMRRTRWHYYHPGMPARAAEVAGWMADAAGWPPARLAAELADYAKEAAKTYPAPKLTQ